MGQPIDVEVTAWPIPHLNGRNGMGMGMLVQDVSLHRATSSHLRLERERFRMLAEQSNGVVYRFEVGPPAGLTYLSPRMHDLLGLDHLEVQADPTVVLARIHPDDGVPFDLTSGSGRFDEGVHDYRVQHADGRWVWVEDRHQPEYDKHGCLVASQGILYDVSARKQLEEARERALADAQETARQLERTTVAQSVFLRSVSHQLRTPMTLVRGFATTLQRRGDDLPPDVRETVLQRLLHGIGRLDEHLSDLLDMQASDDGPHLQHREFVDVAALCFDAVNAIDTNQHRVLVETSPATVHADRGQLARAVTALLRNAIEHTPPGTVVTVGNQVVGDTVVVGVCDDDPGIDRDIADRVFDPFVQGRAAATAPSPGAGIGLTFVRQVALRHGGTAAYAANAPCGSQFTLTLPIARNRTNPRQDATRPLPSSP